MKHFIYHFICHFYRCRTLRMIDKLRHILIFNLQQKETRGNVSDPTSLSDSNEAKYGWEEINETGVNEDLK